MLGTDELINYQNQFVSFKGMTVEAAGQDANGNDVPLSDAGTMTVPAQKETTCTLTLPTTARLILSLSSPISATAPQRFIPL